MVWKTSLFAQSCKPTSDAMRLCAVFAALSVAASSKIQLSGQDSSIHFGTMHDPSAAVLTASCASAQPTFTLVWPSSFDGWGPDSESTTVTLYLGNVAASCQLVSSLRRPCAVLDGTRHPPKPLFYCHFSGAAGKVTTGPVVANASAIFAADGSDVVLGHRIVSVCPLPTYEKLLTLGPYDGSAPLYSINVSMTYWAASGPTAIPIEYAGAPEGNVIDFVSLPAPPPPSPPSPPPWDASKVYVQWGSQTCADSSATLLYSGIMTGSHYTNAGGPSTFQCMHPEPQNTISSRSEDVTIYGVEQNSQSHQRDLACAVCLEPLIADTYVQWGRSDSCSNGHTTLYKGDMMAGANSHHRSEMLCVDNAQEGIESSSDTNNNEALIYFTQSGGSTGFTSKYPSGQALGCSVCGVRAL